MHLKKRSYCGNKKQKYSLSPKPCKSTDTQNESKSTETFSNNQSNVSIDDYCSVNDTSFDDTPLVKNASNNQTESERNKIDDDSISKQDKLPLQTKMKIRCQIYMIPINFSMMIGSTYYQIKIY